MRFPGVGYDMARFSTTVPVRGDHLTSRDHGERDSSRAAVCPFLRAQHFRRSTARRISLYRRVVWGGPPQLVSPVTPLDASEKGLELIHLPGHSPDHNVVWDAERRILFSSDLFLGVKVRVAFPSEEPRLLARSVRKAAMLGPRVMFSTSPRVVPDPSNAPPQSRLDGGDDRDDRTENQRRLEKTAR